MFIDQGQTLLVCYDHGDLGREWLGHSDLNFETAADAAREYDLPAVVQFMIFTHDETAMVDVTEDVAAGYLQAFPGTLTSERNVAPPYVRTSCAWDAMCEAKRDREDAPAFDPWAGFRTTNHAQTGVSRGGRL